MSAKTIEEKLKELGYELPVLPTSKGIYKRCLIDGNHLYVSGHISVNTDGSSITGKLGKDLNEEEGKSAARQCGLAILSSLKAELGDFGKVKRVMKKDEMTIRLGNQGLIKMKFSKIRVFD